MSTVTGLVDGSLTPGVYRVLGSPTTIGSAVSAAGWHSAVLAPTSTTHDFYTELATALHFGDYFGRNLDALWDSLTDLGGPTVLILADWARFARARPERWADILAIFDERSELSPPFAVVLA